MNPQTIKPGAVQAIRDRKLVSDYLSLDRVWASEALASLEDGTWRVASWYAYRTGIHLGLALFFKKLSPMPLFLVGAPNCLGHIVRREVHAGRILVECPLSCVGILKERYHFESASIMNKMQLLHFRQGAFSVMSQVKRLSPSDLPLARALHARNTENVPFDADQFTRGIYFGVEIENTLVSMAGTTVMCPDYRTATVGNVITDSAFRNKGYATSVLIRLCRELLDRRFDCVCIKVNRGNSGAVNIYRKIGFVKKTEYFEGLGKYK
jgi:ribosomal protein S18 acetylase RimI-like enzyme